MSVWVLALSGFNFSDLLGRGRRRRGPARAGQAVRRDRLTKLDFVSLSLALVLGTAGLPHILMRFYTVPTAKEARKSVVWAIWLIGLFYLFTLTLGYGAAALVGPERILGGTGQGQFGGSAARVRTRRHGPARHHLGCRVRDDPRRRRRPHHHRVGVVRPRHLRQRHPPGQAPEGAEVRVARITALVVGA